MDRMARINVYHAPSPETEDPTDLPLGEEDGIHARDVPVMVHGKTNTGGQLPPAHGAHTHTRTHTSLCLTRLETLQPPPATSPMQP